MAILPVLLENIMARYWHDPQFQEMRRYCNRNGWCRKVQDSVLVLRVACPLNLEKIYLEVIKERPTKASEMGEDHSRILQITTTTEDDATDKKFHLGVAPTATTHPSFLHRTLLKSAQRSGNLGRGLESQSVVYPGIKRSEPVYQNEHMMSEMLRYGLKSTIFAQISRIL